MSKKKFAWLLLFVLFAVCRWGSPAVAQCKQNGVVLEYNRRQAKKPYANPVQLSFSESGKSVATVNNKNGEFVLNFNLSKPGDTINNYRVGIANQEYTLFNGSKLDGWVLSPIKRMEVVLCPLNIISYLSKTYTDNYVQRLRQEYDEKVRQLNLSQRYGKSLVDELELAKEQYEREVQQLKMRALLFAYVDETEIDSLEYLWRERILANDIEGATKIGDQMRLAEQAAARANNIGTFLDRSEDEAGKALNLCNIMEQHIVNSKLTDRQWRELNPCYLSLITLYEKLIDVYQNHLRCTDDFLNNLKRRAGDVMTEYGDTLGWAGIIGENDMMFWLRKAAALGSVPALYRLGVEEPDYAQSLNYYRQAEREAERQGIGAWKYQPTIVTREDLRMDIEGFPDFCQVQNGDSLFFHILDSKRAALSYLRHHNKSSNRIVVPESVRYNKRKYTVTKVATGAFSHISGPGMQKRNNPFGNDFPYRNENPFADLTEVVLPNTVDTIGRTAMGVACNVPRSLRKVGSWNHAFKAKNGVVELPEGLASIGCLSFPDSVRLVLPSTLREVDFDLSARNVLLHHGNTHFCQIDGAIYTSDSTRVLMGTVGKRLYIPRKLKMDDGWFTGAWKIAADIDTFVLDKGSMYYDEYDKALYSRNFDTLLFVAKSHQPVLRLHPQTKHLANLHVLPSKTIGIKELHVDGTACIDEICKYIKEHDNGFGIDNDLAIYIFGEPIVLRYRADSGILGQVERICRQHPDDERFAYLCGQMLIAYGDIEGADSCANRIVQDASLASDLRCNLESNKERYDNLMRLAVEAYDQMKATRSAYNGNESDMAKEVKQYVDEIGKYVYLSLPCIESEMKRHPDRPFLYELLGLYLINCHELKKASSLMEEFKAVNPDYSATEFYAVWLREVENIEEVWGEYLMMKDGTVRK